MTGLAVLVAVVILILGGILALIGVIVWEAACRRWERRAERARTEAEVWRAERRLHGMARNAFGSMLDVARQHQTPGNSPRQ